MTGERSATKLAASLKGTLMRDAALWCGGSRRFAFGRFDVSRNSMCHEACLTRRFACRQSLVSQALRAACFEKEACSAKKHGGLHDVCPLRLPRARVRRHRRACECTELG